MTDRLLLFLPALLLACGTPEPEAGARCKQDAATECSFSGSETLLCVSGRWEVQEDCEIGVEECVQSQGQAVCSVGGEACDVEGESKCNNAFEVAVCDGQAWELFSDCFPGSCELQQGEATCVN